MHRLAEPLRQPEQQAVLLVGAELDRMPEVGREQQVGVGSLPGEAHRRGLGLLSIEAVVHQPTAAGARQEQHGHAGEARDQAEPAQAEPIAEPNHPG